MSLVQEKGFRLCSHQIGLLLTHKNGDFGAISVTERIWSVPLSKVDCKTVGFFLKISKEIGKAWRMCLDGLTRKMCLLLLPEKEKRYQSWPTY